MNPPILSKAERNQQGKLAQKCNSVPMLQYTND